jgi:Leucine-rich repeat (LRR) protein
MKVFCLALLCLAFVAGTAQVDSIQYKKIYTSLAEAKKEPLKVYRLNLSHMPKDSFPIDLSPFKNLWYLCLNDDHLEYIPSSIGDLQNLRVLELNGDDFKTLPPELSKLKNLEELYLNVNKQIDLTANVKLLSGLPKLKVLHLEGDGLTKLPPNFAKLTHLEKLYLNNNTLTQVPPELQSIKTLKYVDMHNNAVPMKYQRSDYKQFGFTVNF